MMGEDGGTPSLNYPLTHFSLKGKKTYNVVIGIEEERREYMIEGEYEVNNTSQGILLVPIFPIVRSQSGGDSLGLGIENQDTTLRLPMFHGMGSIQSIIG
jgi:hypothetical protein